jgi:hypothetical protein
MPKDELNSGRKEKFLVTLHQKTKQNMIIGSMIIGEYGFKRHVYEMSYGIHFILPKIVI